MEKRLTELKAGDTGKIILIDGGFRVKRNLENIGIRPGKTIKKISQQLAKGPVIIRNGKSEVALGFGMAKKILIEV